MSSDQCVRVHGQLVGRRAGRDAAARHPVADDRRVPAGGLLHRVEACPLVRVDEDIDGGARRHPGLLAARDDPAITTSRTSRLVPIRGSSRDRSTSRGTTVVPRASTGSHEKSPRSRNARNCAPWPGQRRILNRSERRSLPIVRVVVEPVFAMSASSRPNGGPKSISSSCSGSRQGIRRARRRRPTCTRRRTR